MVASTGGNYPLLPLFNCELHHFVEGTPQFERKDRL
jgi:hypothetical protein